MSTLATLKGECDSLSDNPCIGWCTTRQFGDDRCKGCGRLESEIQQWGEYTILEKKLINIRNAGEGTAWPDRDQVGARFSTIF